MSYIRVITETQATGNTFAICLYFETERDRVYVYPSVSLGITNDLNVKLIIDKINTM